MYLSPVGVLGEASNLSVLRRNGGSEGSCSDALEGAASGGKISPLSNDPKTPTPFLGAGRITADAREKDVAKK